MARGFLQEAEQDVQLGRWRACVSTAQLAVENAAKAIMALYEVPPRTHQPSRHLAVLARRNDIDPAVRAEISSSLAHFLVLGQDEHILADYGNERERKSPWELFDAEAAADALDAARACVATAERVTRMQQT